MKIPKDDLRFSFKDPIYDYTTILVITGDMAWWDENFPDTDADRGGEPCHALYIPQPKKRAFIVIRRDSPPDDLAHEIGHAARRVMGHIGFKIEPENDEPLAYYEGFLTKMIHRGIKGLDKRLNSA